MGRGNARKINSPLSFQKVLPSSQFQLLPVASLPENSVTNFYCKEKKNPINLVNAFWDTGQGQGFLPFPYLSDLKTKLVSSEFHSRAQTRTWEFSQNTRTSGGDWPAGGRTDGSKDTLGCGCSKAWTLPSATQRVLSGCGNPPQHSTEGSRRRPATCPWAHPLGVWTLGQESSLASQSSHEQQQTMTSLPPG